MLKTVPGAHNALDDPGTMENYCRIGPRQHIWTQSTTSIRYDAMMAEWPNWQIADATLNTSETVMVSQWGPSHLRNGTTYDLRPRA